MNKLSLIGAIVTIAIAISGALGYLPGMEALGSISKDFIPMAPSTAICFLLLGLTILVFISTNQTRTKSIIFLMVCVLVSLFGILEVAGYFSGAELNFENQLTPDLGTLDGVPIARMSPATGALFFLSGAALIFATYPMIFLKTNSIELYLVNGAGVLVLLVSFMFCLAYLYGSPLLYGSGATVPMALTTALGFLCLSFSVLSMEKTSILRQPTRQQSTRRILLRYILPLSILSVVVGGIATLPLQKISGANPAVLSSVLTVVMVVIASLLSSFISKHLGTTIDDLVVHTKESEERFHSIFKHAGVGVCLIKSKTDEIIDINANFSQVTGYSLAQLGTLNIQTITHPDDLQEELANMARLLSGEIDNFSMEKRYIHKDDSIVWVDLTVSCVSKNNDKPETHIAIVHNITERKNAEEALRQSQKMEAVGQLTGGIAHDFNNMLGVIMGNLELLRRRVANDAKATEYVQEAYEGSRRGANITKKLLSFTRGVGGNTQITNINDFITGMENLITKSLTPKIAVEIHLADDIWPVNIDPGEFEDALLNLSLNANDAMPDGGSLVIESSNKVLDEQYVRLNPGSTPGEYVMISVSDTGTGMTPEMAVQVFQPFFTSKDAGKGTGLGLSMVYGFIQRSGGHIKVYSEPGQGSTFNAYLPRAFEGTSGVAVVNKEIGDELPRGDEIILVVDDEEGLVKVAVSYLEDLGYKTQTATNGKEAWKILKEPHQIDLVFSDVVMPGDVDGYDLAKATLKDYPNVKFLLTSGFTSKREGVVNGDVPLFAKLSKNLLNKPYNQAELAVAIRQVLDKEDIE